MTRKPDRTEPHPVGGTISWYTLTNGRTFTVLGDGYPSEDDDYEVHERLPATHPEAGQVIPHTETRYPTWDAVHAYLNNIEAGTT